MAAPRKYPDELRERAICGSPEIVEVPYAASRLRAAVS